MSDAGKPLRIVSQISSIRVCAYARPSGWSPEGFPSESSCLPIREDWDSGCRSMGMRRRCSVGIAADSLNPRHCFFPYDASSVLLHGPASPSDYFGAAFFPVLLRTLPSAVRLHELLLTGPLDAPIPHATFFPSCANRLWSGVRCKI